MPKPSEANLELLTDPDEFSLIKKLSTYPSVVQGSAAALEPHRLTFYLQELAGLLHTFYYKHRILPPASDLDTAEDEGITDESGPSIVWHGERVAPGLTEARLKLMYEVQSVIRNGLGMLGISAPDRM